MVPPERPAEDDLNDTAKAEQVTLTADEDRVYDALGPYSVHIDDLARSLSMESGRLSGVLLQLEIKGLVEQLPGKWFTVAPRTDVKKK
jgi:DNA processing protein